MENLTVAVAAFQALRNPPEVIRKVISRMQVLGSPLRQNRSLICRIDRLAARRILGLGSMHVQGAYLPGWMRTMYFVRIAKRVQAFLHVAADEGRSVVVRITRTRQGVIIDAALSTARTRFSLVIAEAGYLSEGLPFASVEPRCKHSGNSGLTFGVREDAGPGG